MSVMQDQPPGWYRDPVRPNRHRYWTGQDWIGPVGENLAVWRRAVRCAQTPVSQSPVSQSPMGQSPIAQRQPPTAQLEENAASNAADGGSNASERTNSSASGAPRRRSMPASSHSTDMGPV